MLDLLRALVLGVIEGLTEFLPVSSTGHMIIAQPLLGVDPDQPLWRAFLFVSQLGAILAVVVYFWRDLWRAVFHARSPRLQDHLLVKLLVAFLPAAVIGLLLNDVMEKYLENPPAVAAALVVGAGIMEWIDRRYRRPGRSEIADVTLGQAFFIGLAQCVSMWPGVSRAAATIMGGMVVGLTPSVATRFSFYLAIPTLGAAGLYRLLKYRADLTADTFAIMLGGTAAAFVVALLVCAAFIHYVQRYRFTAFSVYRVILGVAVLAWYLLASPA